MRPARPARKFGPRPASTPVELARGRALCRAGPRPARAGLSRTRCAAAAAFFRPYDRGKQPSGAPRKGRPRSPARFGGSIAGGVARRRLKDPDEPPLQIISFSARRGSSSHFYLRPFTVPCLFHKRLAEPATSRLENAARRPLLSSRPRPPARPLLAAGAAARSVEAGADGRPCRGRPGPPRRPRAAQRERERERKRERERWRERGGERKRENEREKVREAVLHR